MNPKIVAYCLLLTAYCPSSCSSDPAEKKKEETTGKTMSVDTSLQGVAGTTERNMNVPDGNFIKKYPNGIVQYRGFYVKGLREGQWTTFFQNGNIQSEGYFKGGLRDGKAIVYYENGKVYYEGYYKNGKEVGKWIFYDDKGNKVSEADHSKPNS